MTHGLGSRGVPGALKKIVVSTRPTSLSALLYFMSVHAYPVVDVCCHAVSVGWGLTIPRWGLGSVAWPLFFAVNVVHRRCSRSWFPLTSLFVVLDRHSKMLPCPSSGQVTLVESSTKEEHRRHTFAWVRLKEGPLSPMWHCVAG